MMILMKFDEKYARCNGIAVQSNPSRTLFWHNGEIQICALKDIYYTGISHFFIHSSNVSTEKK